MTASLPPQNARTVRFRGTRATSRAQHVIAGATVLGLAGMAAVGLAAPLPALAFFAVGAGAGYSLSGSV